MKFKHFLAILALALCLTVTAGCGIEEVLGDVAQKLADADTETGQEAALPDENADQALTLDGQPQETDTQSDDAQADTATASDLTTEQEPVEALPEEEQTPVDYTTLSASDCIEEIDGLPYIMVDCEGADMINRDISLQFAALVDDENCSLHYECYKGASRVLSIVMVEQYNDDRYYTPFNLDLQTGQWLSGQALLELLGLDAQSLGEAELAAMGQEFEYEYGPYQQGSFADFYQEQYEKTVSTSNVETSRIWFGANGQLTFAARIYAMAGAEYYEYPMATGYSF